MPNGGKKRHIGEKIDRIPPKKLYVTAHFSEGRMSALRGVKKNYLVR